MQNIWQNLPKNFTVLAPMEDVTDVVFRQVIEEVGGPDLYFTEFTNVDGLSSRGREKVIHRLIRRDSEDKLIAQIWGIKPEHYEQAARDIVEMGFAGVDINMGCPVRKVVKTGVCSALINNPSLAGEIISATKQGADGKIPVSVKTRIGFNSVKTLEWGEFLLNQGLDAITIHGRIAKEMSTKPANWDEVAKIVEMRNHISPKTIIVGNGDVLSLQQTSEYCSRYGVDGVMIGRGVFHNPLIFNPSKTLSDLDLNSRLDLIWRHASLFRERWGDNKPFVILRRFFKIYLHELPNAAELRAQFMEVEGFEELENLIRSLR